MIDEGYIKYNAVREEGAIPEYPLWDSLNECRTVLFDLKLIGVYPNGIGYGNVSYRVGESQFIISGSATGGIRELTRDHYAFVESFNLGLNSVKSIGKIDASSESMSHGAVYRAMPAVTAVIHVHNRKLFDFMIENDFPATPATVPFGTPELAEEIAELVLAGGENNGVLVTAGHDEGVIAYGETIPDALNELMKLFALSKESV